MLVNKTEYHVWPIVDSHEPRDVRPVRGFIAATVTQSAEAEFDNDIRISFLDSDHNVYNSIPVDDMPMFVSAVRIAISELGIEPEPNEWRDAGELIIDTSLPH